MPTQKELDEPVAHKPQNSTLAVIDDYIDEGINITKSTQYGVHAGTEEQFKKGVPLRYSFWKDDIERFLKENDFRNESEFFSEADDVPIIIGGLAYGDPQSPESLLLMTNIRREASKKIAILKGVRERIITMEEGSVGQSFEAVVKIEKKQIIEISVYGGTLIVDEGTGFVELNKVGDTLNLAGKEFKVILTLVKGGNHQAKYSELVSGDDNVSNRALLVGTIRDLKETLGILPKKSSKNKDIIQNIKKYGYKIITQQNQAMVNP